MSFNTASNKAGSLTIAGSGIASVAHITLETVAHIQEADVVFYVVADPVTEAFIRKNAKGLCSDLHVFYDKDKARHDTYVQMAETMLNEVRAGQNVLGIFYGHPGVFVSPSRRALAIAREEGHAAKMLPGVSSEDYMFADLEFDPAVHGCCAFEATHLLVKNTPLDTSVNNILWQVGAVGVSNIDFENSKFKLLVDRLEKDFGPDHKVVHYIGAVLPQHTTVKDTFTISELRKEHVAAQFNACSTLYVLPLRSDKVVDRDLLEKVTGIGKDLSIGSLLTYPVPQWDADFKLGAVPAYGPHEQRVVASPEELTIPGGHRPLKASPAMQQLMTDLALYPTVQAKYRADPEAVVGATPGLTDMEKAALRLGTPDPIMSVMKPCTDGNVVAENFPANTSFVPAVLNASFVPPILNTSSVPTVFDTFVPTTLNTSFVPTAPNTSFVPTTLNTSFAPIVFDTSFVSGGLGIAHTAHS